MKHTVRPISDRTWLRPESARTVSRFDSLWSSTRDLLHREIEHLAGRDLVIEVDVPERGIRQDGQLRADARAATPAVVVAFESRHGAMLYRADRLTTAYSDQGPAWQHNVRAVALTLESLRAVDRYGATETGQQYTGFKAIGGATPMPAAAPTMTQTAARAVLADWAGPGGLVDRIAGVLAEHRWHHTRTTHCACGFRTPLAQLAVDGYEAHVAQAVADALAAEGTVTTS